MARASLGFPHVVPAWMRRPAPGPSAAARRPSLSGGRSRMGEAITQEEHDAVMSKLGPASTNMMAIEAWIGSHPDLEGALGVNATRFRTLKAEVDSIQPDMLDLESSMRSQDPADWSVSAQQLVELDSYSSLGNELWRLIQAGPVSAGQPGAPGGGLAPGAGGAVSPVPASGGAESGFPNLWALLPGAAAVAAPFLRPAPKAPPPVLPAPQPKPSAGTPWWVWALVGAGGLSVLGAAFAFWGRR